MAAILSFMGNNMATLTSCESQKSSNIIVKSSMMFWVEAHQNKVTAILNACFAMCCGNLHEFTSALHNFYGI